MSGKYEFKEIQKNLIDVPSWIPRKPGDKDDKEDEESLKELGDSIKSSGMINPITVRAVKGERYELIAGSRRLAAIKEDKLWAKVEKDIDEFDARLICISENYQRKDIDHIKRDNYVYETFMLGKQMGKIKTRKDLGLKLGIKEETLKKYLNAGEERAINKNDMVITMSSTNALYDTKSLSDKPLIRNKILEMGIDKVMLSTVIPKISKNVESCLLSGINEKTMVKVIDIVMNNNGDSDDNDITKKVGYFDVKEFEYMTTAIVDCKPDVREYVVNRKISVEDGIKISQFGTKEARKQLINEKLKFQEWKEKAVDVVDNEWDKNIKIRQIQESDIKTKGNTLLKTELDIQHQRKLDLAAEKASFFDENTRKKYKKIYDDMVSVVATQHPIKITKLEIKKDTVGVIIETYKLCRLILIDLGVIKNVSNTPDLDFVDVDWSVKEDSNTNTSYADNVSDEKRKETILMKRG